MIILPIYNQIGEFGCFFSGEDELGQFFGDHNNSLNIKGIKLYVVSDNQNVNSNMSLANVVERISSKEFSSFLHPSLPNWVLYDDAFQKYVSGEFEDVLPKSAEIIPTMNCCFRCQQCSYRNVKESIGLWESRSINELTGVHMTKNTMTTVIDRLVEANTKNVVFTGGGEPLMNSEVTLFGMELACKHQLSTGLYTNGLLLSDIVVENIARINPLFIRISIYGIDPNSFEKYTNSNEKLFCKVIENTKSLIQAKREGQLKSIISLSFLVHPTLYPDISAIKSFFENYFTIDDLRYVSLIRFTPAVNYSSSKQHEKKFFNEVIGQVNELAVKYDNITMIVPYLHRFDDLYQKKKYHICRASGYFAEISPNGDLYMCCEKLMDKKFIIGNILNHSISEVYQSSQRFSVMNSINNEKCVNCPTLCKPHEMNKQLNEIQNYKIDEIEKWRSELIKTSSITPYFPGKLNAFES